MTESTKDKKFEQLVKRIDSQGKLLRSWELTGGVSAKVTALEILLSDGQMKRMIVRQHGSADFNQNPHVAADEFKLLGIMKSEGLLTPTPYDIDQSGETFPRPYVIIEFIEGEMEVAPSNLNDYIFQLVTNLSKIHSVDCSKLELSFLPKQKEICTENLKKVPVNLDESLDEGLIRDILKSVWPLPQKNKDVILHGDFWPGNTLWKDDKLVAVIDWEDAAFGDPLADVANGRLEILWAFGMDAMTEFTNQYKAIMAATDFANLPYWDLCAALRPASKISEWGLERSAERTMREMHKLFVLQAFNLIGKL